MTWSGWALFTEDWDDDDDHVSALPPPAMHDYPTASTMAPASQPEISAASPPIPAETETTLAEPTPNDSGNDYFTVCFHPRRTAICLLDHDIDLAHDTYVITEADNGYCMGQIVGPADPPEPGAQKRIHRILRLASEEEISSLPEMRERERRAVEICAQIVSEKRMDLEITDAEYQIDGSQLTLYYTASNFTDFRGLVRVLFKKFSLRIWMVWYDKDEGTAVKDVFSQNKKKRTRHRKPRTMQGGGC